MAETSLIPSVIALCRFFNENFPNIFWYPNWYLGNPFNFLIGPVVPYLLFIFKIIPLPLEKLYLATIFISLFFTSLGLYFLMRQLNAGKKTSFASALFFLVLPGSFFLLNYQNGLNHVAFLLFPFSLLIYDKFLKSQKQHLIFILVLLISLSLLTGTSILLPLIVGFASLYVANNQHSQDKIIKTVLIFLLAISISSIWYSFRFWWVFLSNPSFGGVPLLNLIASLLKSALNFLPLVLAVFVVRLKRFRFKNYLMFGFIFFFSFSVLTIVRFLADPDFIMDWAGFLLELQFGLAIILGTAMGELKVKSEKLKVADQSLKFIFTSLIIILLLDYFVIGNSGLLQFDRKDLYQAKISNLIKNNVKDNQRIFLSGSPVFWINQNKNVLQVRGAKDNASINPFWAQGAFQIREGKDENLLKNWLTVFGANYILVYGKNSKEPFHDFKNLQRFSGLSKREEKDGNILYEVNASVARIVDQDIFKTFSPQKGDDQKALSSYASAIKKSSDFSYQSPNKIKVNTNDLNNNKLSLAITYDPRFRITKGNGDIVSDPLGNILIIPSGKQKEFELTYKPFWYDWGAPVIFSFIFLTLIIFYDKSSPYFKKLVPDLHIGKDNEKNDY